MARKNPFATLLDEGQRPEVAQPALDYAMKGASRSLLSSIDEMATRADKLIQGETIIDLNPDVVDPSFVKDRLVADEQEFNDLVDAIRERGQDSPILVRPHPSKGGRYMVVFGHRRLLAAKALGRQVRAVVKEMKDTEHVVAQGQENSARANLSFIEKAFFAGNLARLRYDEDNGLVLAALSIDRATLSKMLSVASLPAEVLTAIGPAKAIGRDRWYELKLLLEQPANLESALTAVNDPHFSSHSSDERFSILLSRVKEAKAHSRAKSLPRKDKWSASDGRLAAEIVADGKRFTLALKAKGTDATAFGQYLTDHLGQLYEAFRQDKSTNDGD
ncbi:putative replication protein B (plasmid) [Aureimonas sp. SA4125]|uniref:plasmid partitioning protein RepB n=1 Tax=Aureimonas sp. SA4125 TaxID=2826993 RepID=UPI001CC47F9E|nr:plasmid partitioning protein RepB [Aureimonas sp. SA4125]BDA87213.1 putative replication protein B [Aureimonas sp. SA4125]